MTIETPLPGDAELTETEPELIAYNLLAVHGIRALNLAMQRCDAAIKLGDEEGLAYWNDVLNVMYGWG